jgi:hypothetical protein
VVRLTSLATNPTMAAKHVAEGMQGGGCFTLLVWPNDNRQIEHDVGQANYMGLSTFLSSAPIATCCKPSTLNGRLLPASCTYANIA